MGKLIINSYEEFAAHLGEELGTSDWLQVDQDRINLFADATLDHQWIHVDVERAKQESPYKSTIAHGLSHAVAAALSLGPDYRGEQHQDAGQLRHDRHALRTASHHRLTRPSGHQVAQHPKPARHLQGGNQVSHRDRRTTQTSPRRHCCFPLLF